MSEQIIEVENNLGLVHACAGRFKGRGMEYDDLYQAGCMGLVKAIKGFDHSRGLQFSTYAVPVILGEIRRLFRDGGTVKVSRGLKELGMKVARSRELYIKKHGIEPKISEIAKEMEVTEEQVTEAIGAMAPTISLTAWDDSKDEQLDIPVESIEEEIGDMLSVKEAISQLDAEDRKIIVLRYFSGKTQTVTAKLMGLSQVQISRKEKKILSQMREILTG